MIDEIQLGGGVPSSPVHAAIEQIGIDDIECSFPNVSELLSQRMIKFDQCQHQEEPKNNSPSIRYGIAGSAEVLRNVTSLLPESIISPRVGQEAAGRGEDWGVKETPSSPADLKTAS